MRLNLSALFLSTALATSFGAGAAVLLAPIAPIAQAQDAGMGLPSEVDVDALLKLLPPEVKASYESKSYDALSGFTTIKNLKFADPANEAGNNVVIGLVSLRGLDLAAFEYVFDFAKYGATPDETFKQLFGEVIVNGVTITANGAPAGSIESLAFGGVQMKQLQVKPPGTGGAPASEIDGIKFAGALLDSIIAGPLELTNLAVDSEGSKITIGRAALGGYTRGQYGNSELSGFEATGDGNMTKMASARSDGGDLSKVLPWMVKGELPPVAPEPLLYIGAGNVSGLEYDIMGTKVSIASYGVDAINFFWLVPSQFKMNMTDMIVIPAASDAAQLQELGISQLDMDFGLEWTFDGAAGTAQLKELRIDESSLFNTNLSVDLTGLNLSQLVDPNMMQMAVMQIGITGAKLFVKNNGGVDKILAAAAKEEGSTPDAMRQQILDQMSAMEAGMPGPDGQPVPLSDRMKGIVAALKAFVTSPGTLTVTMQPAQPINAMNGMGAMMDPMAAADALGITVESTPQ
ncbi:MAG: hypothetical protein JNL56_02435 [Alphaproteobacteria bacterium]|nr:hypothetical protein [Alphaproteobacteria bacterium]